MKRPLRLKWWPQLSQQLEQQLVQGASQGTCFSTVWHTIRQQVTHSWQGTQCLTVRQASYGTWWGTITVQHWVTHSGTQW